MLRCIHCGCVIPTAGTDKCPNCGEYPYQDCRRNTARKKIFRTKEEQAGWKKIKRLDNV